MNEAEMVAAQARLDAATPGAWEPYVDEHEMNDDGDRFVRVGTDDGLSVCEVGRVLPEDISDDAPVESQDTWKDAEFIAHAPNDLRKALRALARVRAVVREWQRDPTLGYEDHDEYAKDILRALDGVGVEA